jgi:hypothetical protein
MIFTTCARLVTSLAVQWHWPAGVHHHGVR